MDQPYDDYRQQEHLEQPEQPEQPQSTGGMLFTLYAILGPPLIWIAYFNVMYFLVQPICRLGGDVLFHIVAIVTILLIAGSGFAAWRIGQRSDTSLRRKVEGNNGWQGFVGVYGVFSAALFIYASIYVWLPVFAVDACVAFA